MADSIHSTQYRFYLQKYPQKNPNGIVDSTITFPKVDIEEHFKCYYVAFGGSNIPAIKNIYEEDFAERDGVRIWTPDKSELAVSASDITLELLWKSNKQYEVLENERAFYDYVAGQKLEYSDTFRNLHWQLVLKDSPDTKGEKLYGGQQYRWVSYKFRNFGGKPTKESKL